MTKDTPIKSVLLVISGGIAAYKSLELIRLLRKGGIHVRTVLTKGGQQFITPLSVSALTGEETYTDLWSLKDETDMGHIRLSREADLIVIAPASADLLAKMAHGLADDLASTALLAADKPILIAPAMNHQMWNNPATQANIQTLKDRGIMQIGPTEGDMACNEYGLGRMSEPEDIFEAIKACGSKKNTNASAHNGALAGRSILVTSGPTYEALDPVRFIGNRSSGKQGHAIARGLCAQGAQVTLVSGPVAPEFNKNLPDGITLIQIESAQEMLDACLEHIHVDAAVCVAAVSDWGAADKQDQKIKKQDQDAGPPAIALKENPDILHTISTHKNRPDLVIGFAAETQNLLEYAQSKLQKKKCDWILANDVGAPGKGFGSEQNHVYLIYQNTVENWQEMGKSAIADKLAERIASHFGTKIGLKDAAE